MFGDNHTKKLVRSFVALRPACGQVSPDAVEFYHYRRHGAIMTAIQISRRTLCAVLAMLCLNVDVEAHEYFLDDFSDGDTTDGDPVSWTAWFDVNHIGAFEPSDDGWVWAPEHGNMGSYVPEFTYENVSLRTQVRLLGEVPIGGFASVTAYGEGWGGYYAGIQPSGMLGIWSYPMWGDDADSAWLVRHNTGLDPIDNDVHIQFDLFEGLLSLTAWQEGDEKPVAPQIAVDDDVLTSGQVGLFYNPWGSRTPAAFRFFEATPLEAPPAAKVELIGSGEDWSVFPGTVEPSPFPDLAWTTPEFDDRQWATHQDGFGYGRNTETRGVVSVREDMKDNYGSVYLRHSFEIEDPPAASHLLLQLDYDDAFVAYINGLEVARSDVGTPGIPEPFDAQVSTRPIYGVMSYVIDLEPFPELLHSGNDNILAIQGINRRSSDSDFVLSQISLSAVGWPLQAGDADQDYDFDQLDLVKVLAAAKYLTGQSATWGEGDWNGGPGGFAGSPPAGNGVFDQIDIVVALGTDLYMAGPYEAIHPRGRRTDAQTSIVYTAATGELAVDAPVGTELTSINIESASGIFVGQPAVNLGGSFDNNSDANVFKATFGSSFGGLSFGHVAQAGLSESLLLGDLTVIGSLAGGGGLGEVDLVYIPIAEPSTALLTCLGLVALIVSRWNGRRS